ncbi:protein of unknown function [Flavobacterium hercynium]|nr:protein of unknown function [Flavobacterium hercynium]
MFVLKAPFLKVFFLLIIILSVSSCNNNNPMETNLKNETFTSTRTDKEQVETYFFIATANLSKSIIEKSQIAQKKASESKVKEVSKKIEEQQTHLLEEVTKIANHRLIIVTDINATNNENLYAITDTNSVNFDKAYTNSIAESLADQIKIFESISKETNDEMILKLVLQYLPGDYQFLRETETIRENFN